jgi:hypothetical protein
MRRLVLAAGLGLLAGSAHAVTISCPVYPSAIKSTIGSGSPPAEPIVLGVTLTARVGTNALLCEYAVRVTGDYPPTHPISSCKSFPLVLKLVAPDPAPAAGFTSWAFGTPGTPKGSSSTVSAAQTIAPTYSMTTSSPPTRNCQVPNQGVFYFQIYSGMPSGETCTASASSFTCTTTTPALCPTSLQGSQIPTTNWSASSSAPGYYAYESAILAPNGAPIVSEASLSAVKSAMGSSFGGSTFKVPSGTNGYGTGGGLPAGVISCGYDSPQFTYNGQQALAQVTIACTTSCATL